MGNDESSNWNIKSFEDSKLRQHSLAESTSDDLPSKKNISEFRVRRSLNLANGNFAESTITLSFNIKLCDWR